MNTVVINSQNDMSFEIDTELKLHDPYIKKNFQIQNNIFINFICQDIINQQIKTTIPPNNPITPNKSLDSKKVLTYSNIVSQKLNNKSYSQSIIDHNNIDSTLKSQNNPISFIDNKIIIHKMNHILNTKDYTNPKSLLSQLNFTFSNDFIIINTNDINNNLRHTNFIFDRVLHQSKIIVFDNKTLLPIFYREKPIKDNETIYTKNENSYLKSYVYDKIYRYHEKEFDKTIISIHKNHIGSYIVLFYHTDKWYFMYQDIYELNPYTHPILYEHLEHHISKFDKNLCYHIILKDIRLQRLITPICEKNHIILVKVTEKYTMIEQKSLLANNDKLYDILNCDRTIFFSCFDEMYVRLEELDIKNIKSKKLLNRGFLIKVKVDNYEKLHIAYDTHTYKTLLAMIPQGYDLHSVHLKLYQNDKLNYFLQYIDESYIDVIKRINISLSTMSREILDIYHMTRNKKNSDLYNFLPQSYRQILYQLHSDYIDQKNITPSDSIRSIVKNESYHYIDNDVADNCDVDNDLYDNDNKISISVDNVYTKLKNLDTSLLIELFKDRDELSKKIDSLGDELKNPIKECINTYIQITLLKSNRPV
jgi:hypothetical protein